MAGASSLQARLDARVISARLQQRVQNTPCMGFI